MQTKSLFRHLLCDETSLREYMEGNVASCEDVQRRLFELERKENIFVPDHYYRLLKEKCFAKLGSLADMLIVGLSEFADEYIERRENLLYVRAEKQNEWQLLLPAYSPLLLIASKLCYDNTCPLNVEDVKAYHERYVLPNVKYTALLHPYILQMEDFKESHDGMYDLHIHLNGTIESDHLWQDFLDKPSEFIGGLAKKLVNPKVKELFEQFSTLVTPLKLKRLAYDANYIRNVLADHCFRNVAYPESVLQDCMDEDKINSYVGIHPMDAIVAGNRMQLECMFYVYVLSYLKHYPKDDVTAYLLHFYILINGLLNRLCVMQSHFYGFEEFNKYTLGGVRMVSERFEESCRYLQLAGNDLTNIKMLEGRFAPISNKKGLAKTIGKIIGSWEAFNQQQVKERKGGKLSDLSLIAHFIKSISGRHGNYFFEEYRMGLEKRADALVCLKNEGGKLGAVLVGVDAASSEFSTPPEVFAQVYLRLREGGFSHFTFHAGEDFFHLLGGIRAVWEAIELLRLQRGDRIGHAAALGVSASLWKDNVGDRLLVRQGEYLDDLVFAYHLIETSGDLSLQKKKGMLTNSINNLCFEVYGQYYSPFMQVKAWLSRGLNPKEVMDKQDAELPDEKRLLKKYWKLRGSKDSLYDKIIEVNTCEFFDVQELEAIQLLVLQQMHDKEIVIETLPTSNVMIGHHHSYSSYHLYNWYRWGKIEHKPIPPIVLGSDDAGIFATNIFNEYCNVYCQLMYDKRLNSIDVIKFIEELDYNSKLYSFK